MFLSVPLSLLLSLLARASRMRATRELVDTSILRPYWYKAKDGKVATHVLIGEEEQKQVNLDLDLYPRTFLCWRLGIRRA